MTNSRKLQPQFVIAIAAIGVVIQIAVAAISYGTLSESVSEVKARQSVSDQAVAQTNATVNSQGREIATLTAKLDAIKSGVDTLNGKYDSRHQ